MQYENTNPPHIQNFLILQTSSKLKKILWRRTTPSHNICNTEHTRTRLDTTSPKTNKHTDTPTTSHNACNIQKPYVHADHLRQKIPPRHNRTFATHKKNHKIIRHKPSIESLTYFVRPSSNSLGSTQQPHHPPDESPPRPITGKAAIFSVDARLTSFRVTQPHIPGMDCTSRQSWGTTP